MSAYPMVQLRRLTHVVNGGTPTPDPTNWNGDVQWATPIDLARADGGSLDRTDRSLTEEGLLTGSATVPQGSLILSTRAPIGYVTRVAASRMAFNQGCRGLVPNERVDVRFLQYWLTCQGANLQALGSGSTFLELSSASLLSFLVPLPPVDEQRRIADFLDEQVGLIDQLIALRESQLELVTTRRVSSLASMLDGIDAPEVPLRRLLRPRQEVDRADLQVLSVYRDLGVVPKVGREDNYNKTPEDISRYQRVVVDDLVVNKMKAWSGSVAVSAHEGIVSPDYLVCSLSGEVFPLFLHHVLRSPRLVAEMRMRSRGIRPSQERLYWSDLADIRIPLPTIEVQAEVAARIESSIGDFEGVREPFVRSVTLLAERKRSLITAAVTGQLNPATMSDRAGKVATA